MPTKLSRNVKFTVESEIDNTSNHDIEIFDGSVRLGVGAKISKGTVIEAPVLISPGARILKGVSLGSFAYVGRNSIVTNTQISRFCSIAHDCQINYFRGHPTNWLSSHPFQYDEMNFSFWPGYAEFKKRSFDADDTQRLVTIGPDVWLGAKSCIFGGVQIGAGAIVGAGSLVKHDIEPYGVAVGTPAKIIKYRFNKKTIDKLIQLKWWDLDTSLIHNLPFDDIDECIFILEQAK
jgi:acetyltransferase-like isoleucine patch superfamily enzyme